MRDEPKVYPDSNPRAMLERIAETFKDESTRSLLYSMAKRGIRNHGSNNGDKMTEELRAKQIQGPQENYQHNPQDPAIEPSPEHGGLRVMTVAKKGTALVESHPSRRHPQAAELAGLGSPRDRK